MPPKSQPTTPADGDAKHAPAAGASTSAALPGAAAAMPDQDNPDPPPPPRAAPQQHDEPARPPADTDEVKCRIVGPNYDGKRKGEEVTVTRRELRRVGPRVLITLAEEAERREAAERPAADLRAVESDRARSEAWKRMDADRERLHREANMKAARAVIEHGGAKPSRG